MPRSLSDLLLILVLPWFWVGHCQAAAPHAERNPITPPFSVRLDPDSQRLAGIRVAVVAASAPLPASQAQGTVIDPRPLLESVRRYRQLITQAQAAQGLADLAQARFRRLRDLGGSIGKSTLEKAQGDWISANAEAETRALQLNAAQSRLELDWGPALRAWADRQPDRLQSLAQGRIRLIRLVPVSPPPTTNAPAFLEFQGHRIELHYLSPAFRTDPALPQPGALYLAREPGLAIGMPLTAWLAGDKPAFPVPSTAIIHHDGTPWLYVQTGIQHFQRQHLEISAVTSETQWVTKGLQAGQRIVVEGAQILLSAEFRSQVPEEDDDDD